MTATQPADREMIEAILPVLERIAAALERSAPAAKPVIDMNSADAFLWGAECRLIPVPRVNRVEIDLLTGIDRARDILVDNTARFAKGLPANNALLWGARGMGKSSLVKAVPMPASSAETGGRRTAAQADREFIARISPPCRFCWRS